MNPWPTWPVILRTSTSQEEGCERMWSIQTKEFLGEGGRVRSLRCANLDWTEPDAAGRRTFREIPCSDFELRADLVLLAMGFVHVEHGPLVRDLGVTLDPRGNIVADDGMMTTVPGVFGAGDAVMGASLVVWAIDTGRRAAEGVDRYLRVPLTEGKQPVERTPTGCSFPYPAFEQSMQLPIRCRSRVETEAIGPASAHFAFTSSSGSSDVADLVAAAAVEMGMEVAGRLEAGARVVPVANFPGEAVFLEIIEVPVDGPEAYGRELLPRLLQHLFRGEMALPGAQDLEDQGALPGVAGFLHESLLSRTHIPYTIHRQTSPGFFSVLKGTSSDACRDPEGVERFGIRSAVKASAASAGASSSCWGSAGATARTPGDGYAISC